MPVIFVSSPIHEDVLEDLRTLGTVFCGYGPDAVAYDDVKGEVEAVLLRSGTFTARMFAESPKLKIVARHGVGTDTVDIPAATARNVWVTNTPGANSRAVAEHVFALVLSLCRKVRTASARTRNGDWSGDRMALTGIELNGRTIGLLGLGNIGRHVARIAEGFGMRVLVTDPALRQEPDPGLHLVPFDELVRESDILSLHLPLLPSTRTIIDAAVIGRMKDHAILVNTARGGLIDEAALVDALRNGKLGGAALDVLDAENADMTDPLPHNRIPLAEFPNLIVTPHVGGQTQEALMRVGHIATDAIRCVLEGGRPDCAINDVPSGVTGAGHRISA
ncbi:hydroxyacid dehydrogenase [Microvirga tunisiensis]|uniref:Hydroxyacid dehydrogenase n=1 Tax=Microvirga tunisiensis TaxID=2108360 RepID=A0A5N7MKP6_9HYPH|nr:hydroxyacid dehydrogenase [Microvirga tunisiensis]MPR09419.1 hydroxyacid dehydrogenase [Microvirga tunisiensis]MPR27625.1 hydroxyacid dehydrogenase [Microvirga tunisiensis]